MGTDTGPSNYPQIYMSIGAGKGTILPSPATRTYIFIQYDK